MMWVPLTERMNTIESPFLPEQAKGRGEDKWSLPSRKGCKDDSFIVHINVIRRELDCYTVKAGHNFNIKSLAGTCWKINCTDAASPCHKVNGFTKHNYNVAALALGRIGNAVSGKFTLSQCKTGSHKAPCESFYQA